MYFEASHKWGSPELPLLTTERCLVQVGVFDTDGVRPTHLDVTDGGVSFGALEPRTVVMHNGGACSPANNQVRLVDALQPSVVRFTAVAVHLPSRRAVVSTHWVPTSETAEMKGAFDSKSLLLAAW